MDREGVGKILRARTSAIAIFALTALGSIVALNNLFPDPEEPNLGLFTKKVEHLQSAHDRYNVLFIGTSTTYRSVDPIALQKVAAAHGCDVRAFNLGVSKLRMTELRYVRDRLTKHMIGDYDLIVMSPLAPSAIEVANWGSNRIQHFSDWTGFSSSLIDIWQYPTSNATLKYLYYSALLSGSFLYKQLGIGQLTDNIEGWPRPGRDSASGDMFDGAAIVDLSRHGFVALDDEPHDEFKQRRHAILNNPGRFEWVKASAPQLHEFDQDTAARAWERFDRAVDHVAHLEVPTIMYLPPVANRRTQDKLLADHAMAQGMPVLNYNQLEVYPELFDYRKWFDLYHVNKSGAAAITELLGRDICAFIDEEGA